jgi:hypothetical protein
MMPAEDDATVLFLFMAFGSLLVLVLILVAVGMQTWLLWKVACAVIEGGNLRLEKEDGSRFVGKIVEEDEDLGRRRSKV